MYWWELQRLANEKVSANDLALREKLLHFSNQMAGDHLLTLLELYQLTTEFSNVIKEGETEWRLSLSTLIAKEFHIKIPSADVNRLMNAINQLMKFNLLSLTNFMALLNKGELAFYLTNALIYFAKAKLQISIYEVIGLYQQLNSVQIKNVDMALSWLASEAVLTPEIFSVVTSHINEATEIANGVTILSQGYIDTPKYNEILLNHKKFAVSVAYGLTDCAKQGILNYELTELLLTRPQQMSVLASCFCLLAEQQLLNETTKKMLMQESHMLLWISNVLRYLKSAALITGENFSLLIKNATYSSFMTKWLFKLSEQGLITQGNFNELAAFANVLCTEVVCNKLDNLLTYSTVSSKDKHKVVDLNQMHFDRIISLCKNEVNVSSRIKKVGDYLQELINSKAHSPTLFRQSANKQDAQKKIRKPND